MQSTHTLFSEIQKQYTFSPIKTFRLFDGLRRQNKLVEQQDWYKNDGKLFVDAGRFFAELEVMGFTTSVISSDFKLPKMNSNEITIAESEITAHEKIREKSDGVNLNEISEITPDEEIRVSQEEVKSNEIISPEKEPERFQMKSNEITPDENEPAERGSVLSQILEVKDELIDTLKKDVDHFRLANEGLIEQNKELTRMTRLLVAPKEPEVKEVKSVPVQEVAASEPIIVPPVVPQNEKGIDEQEEALIHNANTHGRAII